ncbi:sensor histidine kinase KdpD [Clostridium cylindrosporum]|uniref:Sensor protein KdpD n=1 Tax=Clostridium cylindrosporum DSM 605 TaxID=1121307 RepID=A0A0J8G598_CLOCY|nr:sensor histidine kinase KdpD [Clostridium cylindrosporum]KMT22836.1 sensor protein KdpD [Clostridium cylindrosporum DSM 605]
MNNADPQEIKAYSKEKKSKGKLKIYIGFAPGVGKTYAMLNEANDRLNNGEDIVVGYLETHGRVETLRQVRELKVLDRRKIPHGTITLEEMDLDLICELKPETVLVDELAHTNAPGSINEKRYEDVLDILKCGINVISTMNIQHIESLNNVVREITGVKVRETVPDSILTDAELVLVDITPKQLRERLQKGLIYKEENAIRALKNFFREGNLNALREISLRQIAEEVEDDINEYKMQHGIRENWHTTDRVMVCITSNPSCEKLIRRGARISKRYKCEWIVVNAQEKGLFSKKPNSSDEKFLKNHLLLADKLGAKTISITSNKLYKSLADFAQDKNITQIIIGHNLESNGDKLFRSSNLTQFLRLTRSLEVHIIPLD